MIRSHRLSHIARGVFALFLFAPLTSSAGAQAFTPVGVTSAMEAPIGPVALTAASQPGTNPLQDMRLPIRVGLGVVGSGLGLFGGALLGVATPHSFCGTCSEPELLYAVYGGAIGAVVGGALASSALGLGSNCSFTKRLLIGSLGGMVGAAAGSRVGSGTDLTTAYAYVIGSGVGSGVGAWLCSR